MRSVEDRIVNIVARIATIEPSEVHLEHELTADLAMDSSKALELMCDIEEELEVELPDDGIESVTTVGDLVTWARRATATPAP